VPTSKGRGGRGRKGGRGWERGGKSGRGMKFESVQ